MASHILSRQSSYETLRRRSLVRKVLLESLERRELMAADLWNNDESSYTSTLTQNVLTQASLSFNSTNPNLSGYDLTSYLDSTLGGGSGSLTDRPWFGLIQSSYDQWSQSNGLAFSYSAGLQAEGESDRLSPEGEAGGPRLLSVAPNASSIFTFNAVNTLEEAPTELTLRFDDFIDTSNLAGIRLRAAGKDGQFGNASDSFVTPGWIGKGDNNRIIIMRFSTTLKDDLYRVELSGTGPNAVRSIPASGGKTLETRQFDSTPTDTTVDSVDFRLQLGAKVLAVVPQPVDRLPDGTLQPQPNKIRVYFNDDTLDPTSAQNINYYQLIHTADSVTPNDDNRYLPTSAVYNQSANMVELTFSHDINNLPGAGAGTYRLRIGSSDVVNSVALPANLTATAEGVDIAGNIQSAADLGTFSGTTSILRSGSVITTNVSQLQLDYPGSNFEPGHRDVQAESHIANGADADPGIATIQYNFAETRSYGVNAVNQPLFTSMTPDQKQRVREAFDFYAKKLGVTFQETEASGLTVVVGDMYPINGTRSAPGDATGLIADPVMTQMTILDGAETWDNTYGGNFFLAAMHGIGLLIGYSYDSDLPDTSVMHIETASFIGGAQNNTLVSKFYSEPTYPGDQDIVHGQFMFRPDNRDVDSYKFVVPAGQAGTLRLESMAQRLSTTSDLDTHLTLFKMTASGPEVVATNDNSFGTDSYISIDLEAQPSAVTYYVSITGKGNEDFNPLIPNTGSGAVTQGNYQLRVNFDSTAVPGLFMKDTDGTAVDGDGDGQPGGNFNFWFRAAAASIGILSASPRTIYVDKTYTGVGNGSPTLPMNNLNFSTWPVNAVPVAGDIVRVVGSSATDLTTVPAYEIGRGGVSNSTLSDGLTLQVPKGVTMMIDAGAIFKLQASQLATGSATATVDNSNSALQVLGIPGKPVYFTSYKDESMGIDTNPIGTNPVAGDWGGILFRESVDKSQGRFGWERQGIFLNYVSGADFRYGGGSVTVLSPSQVVSPITMSESRPTIINNTITRSADAAMSADPNSFEETLFTTPNYQMAGNYDPDYSRVGPAIYGNTETNNSINGLFVRSITSAGGPQSTLTVSGKFDDTDIVHVLSENLIVDSQVGGAILDARGPDVSLVQLTQRTTTGATLATGTNVRYKVTAVDSFGNTGPVSSATGTVTISGANNSILLTKLPAATGDFVGRRLWRSTDGGVTYRLVAELDKATAAYTDTGITQAPVLDNALGTTNLRSRPDARLEINPGTVVKATGSRIEVAPGATMLAEGTSDHRIIFTSRSDDRYGAGGSFDTYNDSSATNPSAGDWAGIMARQLSNISVDYALIAYGGGVSPLPGGFAGFNALEIDQAQARVTNTRFDTNGDGSGGNLSANRVGRGPNDQSVIHVVGSQPVIMNNQFVNNSISGTAAISINANALNSVNVVDRGRQTGLNDRIAGSVGNVGPLVKGNTMSNTGITGMRVRGQELTTESIWDDADIVRVAN
ncbi:MAG: pre-peptidase C-terminal domain-containing protein [Pirellulales bacterium]